MSRNPHNLGARGLALYEAVSKSQELTPSDLVTLVEACRISDRLEKFDALINGDRDAWMRLDLDESGNEITVVVEDVVRQARMHASTLKSLLGTFKTPVAKPDEEGGEPTPGEVPSNVASIKQALAAKQAKQGGTAARSKRS